VDSPSSGDNRRVALYAAKGPASALAISRPAPIRMIQAWARQRMRFAPHSPPIIMNVWPPMR